MKNRKIPYGYMYDNGAVVVCLEEANTIKRICKLYLCGHSLLDIGAQLNRECVEYMPGLTGWNKSRLMRIMLDERYLGTEQYPQILEEETVIQIRRIKQEKNTQKEVDRSADIFSLVTPVRCPACGSQMHRRHDRRCKRGKRWICESKNCRMQIVIADKDLLGQITDILNQFIRNPQMLQIPPEMTIVENLQITRLGTEIERSLLMGNYKKEYLHQKMMQYMTLKYMAIDDEAYTTYRMIHWFKQSPILTNFSADFVRRTVRDIGMNLDGSISLTLVNGQVIRKGAA